MDNPPKVSILMNCYNSDEFLREALLSVLNQTYANWELIFIDNQSQDQSAAIVHSFGDRRIRYYKTPKFMTLYQARAFGQTFISGDYLAFLDCDDTWKRNKLEHQIHLMEKNNILFLHSCYHVKYEGLRGFKGNFLSLFQIAKQALFFKRQTTVENQLKHYDINLQTVLLKTNLIGEVQFRPQFNLFGDLVFFIELAKKNSLVFHKTRKRLATTRIHTRQLSKKSAGEWVREAQICIKDLFESLLSESELRSFKVLKLFYKSEQLLYEGQIKRSIRVKRFIKFENPAYFINFFKVKIWSPIKKKRNDGS